MTHPDGTPYTFAERRAIVEEAKKTSAQLLELMEKLAELDDAEDLAERMHGGERS